MLQPSLISLCLLGPIAWLMLFTIPKVSCFYSLLRSLLFQVSRNFLLPIYILLYSLLALDPFHHKERKREREGGRERGSLEFYLGNQQQIIFGLIGLAFVHTKLVKFLPVWEPEAWIKPNQTTKLPNRLKNNLPTRFRLEWSHHRLLILYRVCS